MDLAIDAPTPAAPDCADDGTWLACIACDETFAPFEAVRYTCDECDGLLEVRYDDPPTFDEFGSGASSDGPDRGVWRYREGLPFDLGVTLPEGDTPLHRVPRIEEAVGVDALRIKHEGMNPTGSFKDRGMTVGVRVAKELGVGALACASTGNTSAALAAYGGRGGMQTLVLLPEGKVAAGKIAQASLHGARILEVDGNFDACLDIVQELAARGEAYLLNSLNPFRLEGQKTIGFEILEEFYADYGTFPDRIVLPVGNAGNTSALYKGFRELVQSGALDPDEVPKLTGVQAEGAAPMVEAVEEGNDEIRRWEEVETRATAIRIGNPVNAPKALPGIRNTGGTAVAVSDPEITAAQRHLASEGVGVEPASAASLAGLKKLRREGVVDDDERVVCLTTGHLLKDPDAAYEAGGDPEPVPNDADAVVDHLHD
ncbi:threonine synthase [Halorubrum ezzemoulense]|uniref:Threonine synthase n=3 Tax=Halorubrum ezzemoulense TaxID=337243 RepID=A0A238X6W2_HALEZ|nr:MULTISPECIES: threonine synthase [Halorubrum]MDB2239777.1 threonine synthase [Halorubrum ezzemoulense]MDB2244272.1 threonine synthase [Halorubrum ezzemoulense]MDB2252282.1 threonine synthase [Halorubrum ezzemoulense]MDB2278007.1 threonine synthase [Halorubrum ezzemoulense]MDB2281405.1 threonine synthase [Halorubrum ezzemoulense]